MENGVSSNGGVMMFSEEEVREMSGLKRGDDYVEVTCGCTSHRYGDAVGRLRVSVTGDLEITCECTPGCQEGLSLLFDFYSKTELSILDGLAAVAGIYSKVWLHFHVSADGLVIRAPFFDQWSSGCTFPVLTVRCRNKLTPAAFEKHSGRETARKWKNNVWVMVNGEKVPIFKTALLKYYNQASKNANGSHNGRVFHRDEFVCCTHCNKERRFRLRTKEECRSYHDALAENNWKCSDMPYDKYVFPALFLLQLF
ncbi:unnamed protein product [Ilex paraguariensis]|uniref:Protein ULTRAPETALA 1 n=1 Tax=Ilex paraguariensis TaxID=185542 RepID=A0ABC8S2C1_9AQUA